MSLKLDQHREEREIETTAEIKQIIQSHLLPSLSQCVAYLDDVANWSDSIATKLYFFMWLILLC